MQVLKGFATHALFTDNQTGKTSPFGEITTYSLTFSQIKGYYVSEQAPDIGLITFTTKIDDVDTPLTPTVREQVLSVIKWIYDKTIATAGEIFPDEFLNQILEQFQLTAVDFECGPMVHNDTNQYIPEWVSWKLRDPAESFVRIWFADDSFRRKFDESKIVVIPPIENVDDFFLRASQVDEIVKARTPAMMMEITQDAKLGHPETIIRTETFDWINPMAPSQKISTTWNLLIYGPAGNNIDSIKDALVDYILTHSSHTRDEWLVIFPDIFRRTEFIIIPGFDRWAMTVLDTQEGVYSPMVPLTDSLGTIKAYAYGYKEAHINNHGLAFFNTYKSLSLLSIGSDENRDALYRLTDVFPDYIAVGTESRDFNRMSASTRAWSEMLYRMILAAETMTEYSDIPAKMTKLKRGGKLFLVSSFENIHYLVVARSSMVNP